MSYTISATFATAQEAATFIAALSMPAGIETKAPPAEAQRPVTTKPKAEKTAEPAKTAASHSAQPAAEPEAAGAQAAAPAAKPTVDYPTLQKEVFKLAGMKREAAGEVAAAFGVKTFKELDASKWDDALAAVKAKIATLESEAEAVA